MRRSRSPSTALSVCLLAATLVACTGGQDTSPAPTPSQSAPTAPPSAPDGSAAAVVDLEPTTVEVVDRLAGAPFDAPRTLLAPPGWTTSVYARLDGARQMAFTPEGSMLVTRTEAGLVVAVGRGEDGVGGTEVVLEGLSQPHGLAFDGDTLYVAESDRVDAYDWVDGRPENPVTVVDGLPDDSTADLRGQYAHALKSLTLGADGALYITVGSTGNASAQDREASPERATILRVPPGTRGTDARDAEVFARGVRNGTALATDPDGEVWTAVNNRDNTAYPYRRAFDATADGTGGDDFGEVIPDYVDDHPLEPVARLSAGRDLGWPYCNPDPDVDPGVQGSALDYADPAFVRDVQTNPDGEELDCEALPRVEQGLPAHSAPLGMSFADVPDVGTGALVGVHGSWNREPPRAPNVTFFPWEDGALGDGQVLLSGWQGEDGQRWGRPVAAVLGPDGAVYVTDDDSGTVYRAAPAG